MTQKTIPDRNSLIQFSCKHTRVFPNPAPRLGDTLWCPKCRAEVTVEHAPDEWRIRCVDCIYARAYGAAKINAEIAASKHRMRKTGHTVRLYNGNKLMRTFDGRNQTAISLSSHSDLEIPF